MSYCAIISPEPVERRDAAMSKISARKLARASSASYPLRATAIRGRTFHTSRWVTKLADVRLYLNFRPLRERNFASCCIVIFCAFAVLYAASTSLPSLLQSLFGYDALSAGLVMSPAGFFAVVAMPVVGRLLGRGTDARWVITAGLLAMAAGNYWMSQMNLDISPGQAVWPRVVLIVGLAVCFAPANVAAYLYVPVELRGAPLIVMHR